MAESADAIRKPRLATEDRAFVGKKDKKNVKPVQEYDKGDKVWHDDCICLVVNVDSLPDGYEYKLRDVRSKDEKSGFWVKQSKIADLYQRAKRG